MARKDTSNEKPKTITDWFRGERADQLPRRHEVWALLGWYHTKVVEPQLGFTGMVRRWWWMMTGRVGRLSPWREIVEQAKLLRAHREIEKAAGLPPAVLGASPERPAQLTRAD